MKERLALLKSRMDELAAEMDGLLAEADGDELVLVVVKLTGTNVKRAFLAGRKVHFDNGTGRILVPHGKHRLLIDVIGLPGTECTVGIVEPEEAAFERNFVIDDDGSTGGVFTITV